MTGIKEVDRREVVAFEDRRFQLTHEARGCHREIVPHHHDGLQLTAVALAQGVDKLSLLLGAAGVQPLLELIHHDHNLVTVRRTTSPPQVGEGLDQSQISRQVRQPLAKSTQDPGFGFFGRCFHIDRDDRFRQVG